MEPTRTSPSRVTAPSARADEYDAFYRSFDSELMRQVRIEAYGEDIGQHSWVTAAELRGDAPRLRLGACSRMLDLGSGPCGPLTYLLAHTRCSGVGMELSPAALAVGRRRARALGVEAQFAAMVADLNEPLPPMPAPPDAVLAIDVVLHVRDRNALLRQISTLLRPGGRLLFTDAGVVTGALSNAEIARRSIHGYTQFCPSGWNEACVRAAGLRLVELEDRTESVVRTALGRLKALDNHRDELERLSGVASYASQIEYVSTVAELASRGALSRYMYLAERREAPGT